MVLEFKINIEESTPQYIDYLILGLVHAGYDAFIDYENKNVCFTGHHDEVITNNVEIKEKK